jgi:hypothetical protein
VAEIIGSVLRRHVAMATFRQTDNGIDDVASVIRHPFPKDMCCHSTVGAPMAPNYPASFIFGHGWGTGDASPSHFAAFLRGSPLSIIKQYIEQQHRPDWSGLRPAGHPGLASSQP